MSEAPRAIVAFEVAVAEYRKPANTMPLDNFDGNGNSVARAFASYLKSLPSDELVQFKDGKYFGKPTDTAGIGRTVRARVTAGSSGLASEFKRPDGTGFSRRVDDIEEMSFGIYFLQPKGAHVGYLLAEVIGGRSTGQGFRARFIEGMRRAHPNVMLTMSPVAHTDAWREAEHSAAAVGVKSIAAIHRGVEKSIMDQMGIGGASRPVGEYQQVIKFGSEPASTDVLARFRQFWNGPGGIVAEGGTIALQGEADGGPDAHEADELVAEVMYQDGKTRTVRCSGARPPAVNYELSVRANEDPHLAFQRAARIIVTDLVKQVDCVLEPKWDDGEWEDWDLLSTTWGVTKDAELEEGAQASGQ